MRSGKGNWTHLKAIAISYVIVLGFLLLSISPLTTLVASTASEVQTRALADSPWPTYKGNNQRTGLSEYDTSQTDGTIMWEYQTYHTVHSSPLVTPNCLILYTTYSDAYLLNYDGSLEDQFSRGTDNYINPALSESGIWYNFNSYFNFVGGYDLEGNEVFRYDTPSPADSSPVISEDDTIYIGCQGILYAIRQTERLKWSYNAGGGNIL